jgi:glycosyltransferase involved in cell wall biosynthesis
MNAPKVSIGLPVYNGEAYIADAIKSVLMQTVADWELIISDNASIDGTERICREFASADARIRYVRRAVNIGAAPNFNEVVKLASGEYFKWLAHDDTIAPTFLEKCIDVLAQKSNAVLACPRIRFVDQSGAELERYRSPFRTDDEIVVVRFAEMLRGHPCYEIFGLIRTCSLVQTKLIGSYNHGDGVLLAHLALMGPFAEVPEYLFNSRRHERQSMYLFGITTEKNPRDFDAYARWFDPKNKPGLSRSFNKALYSYARMITVTRNRFSDRVRCYAVLFRWLLPHWRILAGEWKRTLYHLFSLPLAPLRNQQGISRQ